MKILKKLLAVLLILTLACSLLPGIAIAAPSDYVLTGGSVTLDGTADRLIDVNFISVRGGSYYSFSGDWAKTETQGSGYLTLSALTSEKASVATENDVGSGRTVWLDMTYSSPITVAEGGTIWTATYTVDKNTPSGTYTVSLNVDGCTAGDYNADPVGLLTAEITVTRSDSPVTESYSITVSADQTEVEVDDTVKISLNVTNSSADAFNAFYGTLYYDSEAFSYSSASSRASGFVVNDSAYGKLEISRAGSDVSIPGSGSELSLTFIAEAAAESAVFTLRNARVDMADKANGDAAAANVSGMPSVKVTDKENDDKIHVTMRLIGAELAEKDVDLGKTKYLPDYVTWIPTTKYELDKDSYVYDLWVMATEEAGIRSIGANKNYVSTVYAPDSLGGYALSEFTNGRRSGWMYTIDGKHPGYGLKEQKLEDGDVVIWHYVNDYSYEVDDWFSEGQWQALGDGTYYNRWLLAPDRFGGKGGGVSEDEESEEEESEEEESEDEESEENGENGSEPVVEEASVTVIAEVTEGTAEAEVTTENVTEALEENEKAEVLTVTVVSEEADSVTLTVGSDAVQTIADAEVSLNVVTDQGSVTISAEDVGSLAAENGDVAVSIENHENGTTTVDVTVNGETADVSVKVALPTVEDGQVVVVVNEDGTEEVVRKSVVEDGTAYAELPAGTTIKIVDNAKDFDDVPADAWYADSVDFVSSHELFEGTDKGFEPSMNMTRAMLVTVLFRLENEPDATASTVFTDVKEDSWYADAVEWAASSGIVNGVGNDLYDPNGDVTREQIATMLYRYVKHLGLDVSSRGSLDKFYDGDQVSDWAKDAMQWAVKLGIFQGDDTGSLNPKNKATRAEVATLMERIVKLLVL